MIKIMTFEVQVTVGEDRTEDEIEDAIYGVLMDYSGTHLGYNLTEVSVTNVSEHA